MCLHKWHKAYLDINITPHNPKHFKAPPHHIRHPSQPLTCMPKSVGLICNPVSLFFPNLHLTSQFETHTKVPSPKYALPPTQWQSKYSHYSCTLSDINAWWKTCPSWFSDVDQSSEEWMSYCYSIILWSVINHHKWVLLF